MTSACTSPAPLEAPGGSARRAVKPDRRPGGLWAERYDLIDAWRGLAALAVVVHHVAHVFIGGTAVMLFFVISGYCIAASADSCQRKGLGFGQFMKRRIRRIYPPYLLSIAFWAATRVAKWVLEGQNDLVRPVLHWVQNITLTQWVSLLADPASAASKNTVLFVAAYWSLCYEEQFYILMGLMVLLTSLLKVSVRTMVVVLIGAGLIWNAFIPELCYGLFIEYWALFGFGALIFYRLCRMNNPVHRRLVDGFLVTVLAVSVYLRWFAGIAWAADAPGVTAEQAAEMRIVYEELAIAAGFALLLVAMRPLNIHVRGRWWFLPFAALGHITFSLYLIHQFNMKFVREIVERGLSMAGLLDRAAAAQNEPTYSQIIQIAGHIAIATVFWYFCERPFLNKSLLSDPAAPPPAPAPTPDQPAR